MQTNSQKNVKESPVGIAVWAGGELIDCSGQMCARDTIGKNQPAETIQIN